MRIASHDDVARCETPGCVETSRRATRAIGENGDLTRNSCCGFVGCSDDDLQNVRVGLVGNRVQCCGEAVGGIFGRDNHGHGWLAIAHVAISCLAVPSDLTTIADPRFILLAWSGGLALVAGVVALVRIVGPGFVWLTAGSAGFIGIVGALAQDAWPARVALGLVVVALIWARNGPFSGAVLTLAGLLFIGQAASAVGVLPAATVALALGGVTGEMLLGHWYLIDPRLPRLGTAESCDRRNCRSGR